jgi:hypothetical protein
VVRAARNFLAKQIEHEPSVRKFIRERYRNRLSVCTEPTTGGKEQIDQTHQFNGACSSHTVCPLRVGHTITAAVHSRRN